MSMRIDTREDVILSYVLPNGMGFEIRTGHLDPAVRDYVVALLRVMDAAGQEYCRTQRALLK